MKRCNTIYEQVNDNTKDIAEIKNQLPFKYYKTGETLTTTSTTATISSTNAPSDTEDGYLITKDGLLFKIDGANDTNFLITYYANLKGTKGDKGEKGNDGAKGDKGDDGQNADFSNINFIEEISQQVYIAEDEDENVNFQIGAMVKIATDDGQDAEIEARLDLPIMWGDGVKIDIDEEQEKIVIGADYLQPFLIESTDPVGTLTQEEMQYLADNRQRQVIYKNNYYNYCGLSGLGTANASFVYSNVNTDGTTTTINFLAFNFGADYGEWQFKSETLGGGDKVYQHNITLKHNQYVDRILKITIFNKDNSPINSYNALNNYLYVNGFNSNLNGLASVGQFTIQGSGGAWAYRIWSTNSVYIMAYTGNNDTEIATNTSVYDNIVEL